MITILPNIWFKLKYYILTVTWMQGIKNVINIFICYIVVYVHWDLNWKKKKKHYL